jgi:pyruvate/2-oxoglutarate dehydrogenase complex dihydrolipoamide dehydrogenase (E3) component
VLAENPDAVIVATGASYSIGGRSMAFDADIPGHDRSFVYRPEEILLGHARPTGKVMLFDGEGLHTSVGIAELLASAGAELHYVTAGFSPLSARLVDNFEARFLMQRLKAAGVRFVPTSWARHIGDGTVTLYDTHTEAERIVEGVDAVILATGRVPQDGIARQLEGRVPQLFTIGDALAARPLATATYEAQKFARCVGEPDAPASISEAWFRPDDPSVALLPADLLPTRG